MANFTDSGFLTNQDGDDFLSRFDDHFINSVRACVCNNTYKLTDQAFKII